MRQEERKPAPQFGVVVSAIGVAVLVYVLSIGPACWLVERGHVSRDLGEKVYFPLIWAHDRSETFGWVIESYVELWVATEPHFSGMEDLSASPSLKRSLPLAGVSQSTCGSQHRI